MIQCSCSTYGQASSLKSVSLAGDGVERAQRHPPSARHLVGSRCPCTTPVAPRLPVLLPHCCVRGRDLFAPQFVPRRGTLWRFTHVVTEDSERGRTASGCFPPWPLHLRLASPTGMAKVLKLSHCVLSYGHSSGPQARQERTVTAPAARTIPWNAISKERL